MTTVNSVILRPAFPGGFARMAELVDASDSKSGYRKVVQVRFLFRARRPLSFAEGSLHLVAWLAACLRGQVPKPQRRQALGPSDKSPARLFQFLFFLVCNTNQNTIFVYNLEILWNQKKYFLRNRVWI